jgi:membrane protease YdiL (CAAX protease family)
MKSSPTLLSRIVRFPLTRIVLSFLIVMVPTGLVQAFFIANRSTLPLLQSPAIQLLAGIFAAGVSLLMYVLYVRAIERRPVAELALPGAGLQIAGGVLFGALLFTLTIGILWLLGAYHILRVNVWSAVIPLLALSISSGVVEEILFRGILFRILQEALGSWVALLLSGLVFGALHLLNPNATLLAGAAIALEAGLLLGAAYMLTRRLWFPIGIHFAWNFVQGGIFGVAVSGNVSTGLFVSSLTGPGWLSGGAFGAEASLVAVVVCLSAFALLIWQAFKRGHIVPPFQDSYLRP